MIMMKEKISRMIREFVREYEENADVTTRWGEPLIGFADANHPYVLNLKNTIKSTHKLPTDVLSDASIVITYFVPFTKELAKTNCVSRDIASLEWALAYEETNAMLGKINAYLIKELREMGYRGDVSPEATTFDKESLKSNWSHRHFARVAGMGTFGVNNMLITKVGCCGRYSSIVTNIDALPDLPLEEEYCFYKKNGSCGVCVKHCPTGALTLDGFEREECYKVLRKNAKLYTEFGSSYTNETDEFANSAGSEVCGKCVVNAPCAFFNYLK